MNRMASITAHFRRSTTALALLLLGSIAVAQNLPSYYPDEGFTRTGRIDAVLPEEERIIINDVPYQLASNLVVHALNAYSVPRSRLSVGTTIGYRTAAGRQIAEIWILPADYNPRRGR